MKIVVELEIFKEDRKEAKLLVFNCLRHIERLKLGKIIRIDC